MDCGEKKYIYYNNPGIIYTRFIGTCSGGAGGTASTSSATSREKSHYPYLCVCVCVCVLTYIMLVLRFDHIVIECVCDVLDIIIVITVMMVSFYIIFGLRRKTYKLQTTAAATGRLAGNIESRAGQTATFLPYTIYLYTCVFNAMLFILCAARKQYEPYVWNPSRSRNSVIHYPPTPLSEHTAATAAAVL